MTYFPPKRAKVDDIYQDNVIRGSESGSFDENDKHGNGDGRDGRNIQKTKSKARRVLKYAIILSVVIGAVFGVLLLKTGFTFSQMMTSGFAWRSPDASLSDWDDLPEKDEDRINILILGIRGANDPNGGLLSDTIMIASIKKSTGQIALISIPRDLYVDIPRELLQYAPNNEEKSRINLIYALGEEKEWGSGGLKYGKLMLSKISGVYIDYAVRVNFKAFKDIVDILGGVTVYLSRDFVENSQWGDQVFYLPAGSNHLDGEKALYFVRSRYSTSDFDRARRQQQIIIAMKDKALSLGVLANPVKIFNILNSLGNNVLTDAGIGDIKDLLALSGDLNTKDIKRKVFDTSEQGLLYSDKINGAFVLLPVGGNFDNIHDAVINIFDE